MTHNERVLQLLADGRPHSHHELYALNVIAHSRVSDLRKRGHVIEMWREDDLYLYRLVQDCTEGADPPREAEVPHLMPVPSVQLSLEAA